MKCEKPFDVVAFLKDELAESERGPAKAHFESCPACSTEISKFDALLKTLGKMKTEAVAASPDLKWRVRAAFVEAHPEFLERTLAQSKAPPSFWESLKAQFSYVPAWAISVAAHVILLAIAAAIFFAPKSEEETWNTNVKASVPAPKTPPAFDDPKGNAGGNSHVTPPDIDQPPIEDPDRPRDPRDPIRVPKRRLDDKPFEGPKWTSPIRENRFAKIGEGRAAGRGANPGASKSVDQGLDWLARQQEEDGHWDASKFGGKREFNVGVTGLVLLAFLGNGETPTAGAHAGNVKRGVAWLVLQQRRDGVIGPVGGNVLYNHGIAALALLECWLLTKDDELDSAVEAAVSYTMKAQNDAGGWGYTARADDNDTSVGGWQIMVLRLALAKGNRAVIPVLNAARDRLNLTTDSEGKVGYRGKLQFPNGPYALTAVGMMSHILASPIPDKVLLEKQAVVILDGWRTHPVSVQPTGFGQNDLYYWYFASLALHQFGGEAWGQWTKSVEPLVMRAQQADGAWPQTFDRWATYGGQLYTTAMASLILESGWRYPRLTE